MDINKFQELAQAIRQIRTELGRLEKIIEDEKVKFEENKITE